MTLCCGQPALRCGAAAEWPQPGGRGHRRMGREGWPVSCDLTQCFWIQLCMGLQWPSGSGSCLVTFSVLRII